MICAEVVDDELSSLGFLGQGICTLLLLYSLLAEWRSVDLATLVRRGCRSIHWTRWGLLGLVVIVGWRGGDGADVRRLEKLHRERGPGSGGRGHGFLRCM